MSEYTARNNSYSSPLIVPSPTLITKGWNRRLGLWGYAGLWNVGRSVNDKVSPGLDPTPAVLKPQVPRSL